MKIILQVLGCIATAGWFAFVLLLPFALIRLVATLFDL